MKTVVVAVALAAGAIAFGADFTLYNVVPLSLGRENVAAADAKEYFGRTGNDLALYFLTFTLIAGEHPAFILTDDDIRAFSHEAECFCERHMKLFNERHGTCLLRGRYAEVRAEIEERRAENRG